MTKNSVTLYYADYCSHCHAFMPEWNKLKQSLPSNYQSFQYESSRDSDVINNNSIDGFPTIRIKKGDTYLDYVGERTAEKILDVMTEKSKEKKSKEKKIKGGTSDKLKMYKHKYIKYKHKYINYKNANIRN
jgi:thiol-disulfide isomerase/thioredoxin